MPTPPQGLFGLPDIGKIVDSVTNLLPPQVQDAIKDTVGKLVDPADHSVEIGDPQPEGAKPIPVDPGTPEMTSALKAIDAALAALALLTKLSFVIPDEYEVWIVRLQGALTTIRGWLD